jgi:hypothetical protein
VSDAALMISEVSAPAVRRHHPDGADIDIQIATAHAYPRSLTRFKERALAMATLDEETAASCWYTLPRGGKVIEGPSVRLAEIVGSAWGNLRYGARVVGQDRQFVTAQGLCHDLEVNVAAAIEVKRRITDKHGKTFNDDMIAVTGNAASSIALRNAVFRVIPFAFVKFIYDQARLVATGDVKTLSKKRDDMLAYFGKMGLSAERVLASVGKRGVEDVGLDELRLLKGFATAIKDGEADIDTIFPDLKGAVTLPVNGSKSDRLAAAMGAAPGVQTAATIGRPTEPTPVTHTADTPAVVEAAAPPADAGDAWEPPAEPEPAPPAKRGKLKPIDPARLAKIAEYTARLGLTDEAFAGMLPAGVATAAGLTDEQGKKLVDGLYEMVRKHEAATHGKAGGMFGQDGP